MRIGRRLLAGLSAVLLLAGLCLPAIAAENTEKTVRVGYLDYDGFIDPQSDGTYSGYGAEYLSEIAKYTGYQYEYVYGQWSDLLEQLKNQEIDLLCTAQYTEERAAQFDYSAYPIGYTQGLLYTRRDNDDLCYEDFEAFDGMSVGTLRGSAMTELLMKYAEQNGFSCTLKEYDTETQLTAALDSGEIDAMCSEHLANHSGLSLLASFGADAYYIISYQGSPYIEEINSALQSIKANVDFETNLYHKYYDSSTAATSLQFTTAEKEYIAQSDPIVVALNAARAPMSYYDEESGSFQGICVDMLEQIAEKSGLSFEYVSMETGVTTSEMLASGNYDLICGIERDNFATNEEVDATEAFLESAIVPVGRTGANLDLSSALTVAIPRSFQALQKQITAKYPALKITCYDTNRDCLDAVIAGDADLFIQNTHIISLLLQEPRYEGLSILPIEIMTEHTAIALSASANPLLLSILNKSIDQIDQATISSSLITHTVASPYHYTFSDFLYKFKVQIIVIALLVLICFGLLAGITIVQHRNEEKLEENNRLLADSVAQADRASVAKSQFLSRMSHEIRTPMNAIVGLTEIAKQHEEDPQKVDDFLGKIAVSSKVLLNIINDVLDMSAIESNKLQIASAEFDVKQVLDGIRTIYYPQCQNKGVRFEMATDVKNERLVGDSLRTNQVLMNLVSNAYKFTDAGGTIRIAVQETAHKDNTAFLRFTVSDTGCGMTADMKERLFRPFEQEAATTAQRHGGSGLGLSIAKNLVDLMHGAISVESEKGAGTTFTVDLPFGIAEDSTAGHADTLANLRVLVVDDNERAREYASLVLDRLGVSFDAADSGEQTLIRLSEAAAAGAPYDVCLIDWKMPNMDGIELTRRIRECETEHMPVIIVSAYDPSEVYDEAKAAGADYFISKPLFQSTLVNVLMTLTKGERKLPEKESVQYDFTGHRVLLAEDQELNAEIAIELLGLVNMAADHAENGKKAVELFAAAPPGTYDVILMDVQMPEMDGYEATKAIRQLDRPDAASIPIFAMTANAFTEDISAAISAGMNGHIAKPIDTQALYEHLYSAIFGNGQA